MDTGDLTLYLRAIARWDGRYGSAAAGEIEIITDPAQAREALRIVRTRAFHKRLQASEPSVIAARLAREETMIGVVFEDPFMEVFRDLCRFPSGFIGTYEHQSWKLAKGTGICVAPITEVGLVVLSDAYRHAVRTRTLEFTRGGLRSSEVVRVRADGTLENFPARSIADEVLHETGYEIDPDTIEHLGEIDPDSGLCREPVQLFAVSAARVGPPQPDETEAIYGAVELGRAELEACLLSGYYEHPAGSPFAGTRVRVRGSFEHTKLQRLILHKLIA